MSETNALSQRGDPMEVSLTMVQANHSILAPRNLEAEASGLLDRMLGIFQESIRYAKIYSSHLHD
jgi:symplekin